MAGFLNLFGCFTSELSIMVSFAYLCTLNVVKCVCVCLFVCLFAYVWGVSERVWRCVGVCMAQLKCILFAFII